MKLSTLIATLQEMAETHGEDTEVVCAYQETYPLRGTLHSVAEPIQWTDRDLENIMAENEGITLDEAEDIFYEDCGTPEITIVVGGTPHEGSPYGRRELWER